MVVVVVVLVVVPGPLLVVADAGGAAVAVASASALLSDSGTGAGTPDAPQVAALATTAAALTATPALRAILDVTLARPPLSRRPTRTRTLRSFQPPPWAAPIPPVGVPSLGLNPSVMRPPKGLSGEVAVSRQGSPTKSAGPPRRFQVKGGGVARQRAGPAKTPSR